jgi:hypothetical protein
MTQDEIIEMARQAGYDEHSAKFDTRIEVFAKLVRNDYSNKHAQLWLKRIDEAVKAEREACAKLVEEPWMGHPKEIAKAIRARGEA